MDRGAHDGVSNRVPEYRLLPIRHDVVQTVRRPILQGRIANFQHRLFRIGFSSPNAGLVQRVIPEPR